GATVLGALAVSAWHARGDGLATLARRWRGGLRKRGERRRWWLLAVLTPMTLAALMSKLALEGLPHFSDALTYLMQGRVIWSGQLALPKPPYPDLWIGSLFFVTDQQHVDPA